MERIVATEADIFLLNTGTRMKQIPMEEMSSEMINPSAAYCYRF